MPTLGHTLATERTRQNLDLEQVAAVTRISSRFLKAIEHDDFDQLPGRVFARNFVRQYAEYLKLDGDAVLAQFEREQSPPEPQDSAPKQPSVSRTFSLNLPAITDVFGNTTLTSFLTFLLTIGICAGGVWTFDHLGAMRAKVSATPPAKVVQPSARVQQPAAKPPTTPQPVAVLPPSQALPAVSSELNSPAIPPSGATVHVIVAATDSCWTRITADGKVLFAGVLNAGETREVNAASVVDLRAGNAGGLALKLNGSDLPPLGPKGQIRSVILNASGAHVRTPIPDPVSEPL